MLMHLDLNSIGKTMPKPFQCRLMCRCKDHVDQRAFILFVVELCLVFVKNLSERKKFSLSQKCLFFLSLL